MLSEAPAGERLGSMRTPSLRRDRSVPQASTAGAEDRSTGHDFHEKVLRGRRDPSFAHLVRREEDDESRALQRPSSQKRPTQACRGGVLGGASVEAAGQPPQPSAAAGSRVASELAERGASPRVRPERGGSSSPHGRRSSPAAYAVPVRAARLTGSGPPARAGRAAGARSHVRGNDRARDRRLGTFQPSLRSATTISRNVVSRTSTPAMTSATTIGNGCPMSHPAAADRAATARNT